MEISRDEIRDEVCRALNEDMGSGDLTAALIPAGAISEATVITREAAVICGMRWFDMVFAVLDSHVAIEWQVKDGDHVAANQRLCLLRGPSRSLLTGERCALNFLQTLSGTATAAWHYVDAVKGTDVRILDTRKTIPGLRRAQKYAVTCGGGKNHRIGLYDGVLIKENHITAAGSIGAAVSQARAHAPKGIPVEVEVETLHQVHEAIAAGADILLLDNMNLDEMREAVTIVNGHAKVEASGGVNLANIKAIAETGVDYISIGAITKHLHAIDLSMRFN
jgi:nicotinate-nucleotide pyrophosphorylase (carboxylating)